MFEDEKIFEHEHMKPQEENATSDLTWRVAVKI